MSKFKVGDRVVCTCGQAECVGSGVVISVHDTGANVKWDASANETSWPLHRMRPVAPAPPVAVAPTLETATGAELDRIASEHGAGPRYPDEGDASFRLSTQAYVAWKKKRTADVARVTAGDPGVTQAEWSDAIARINAQHKALDTVRRFLGSHSFASCSLACNREMREVMAVVLKALDGEKAGK